MSGEPIYIQLIVPELSSELIQRTIDRCFEFGCTTEENSTSSQCRYISEITDYEWSQIKLETAIANLTQTQSGSLQLWYEGFEFLFSPVQDSRALPDTSHFHLSIDPVYFKSGNFLTKTEAQSNIQSFVKLVARLSASLSPVHVCGYESSIEHCPEQEPLFDVTLSELADGYVDRLFWLNIFNPAAVKRLGRDDLLTAPVWRTEELADGSVLFVVNDTPLYFEEDSAPLAERLGLRPPTL